METIHASCIVVGDAGVLIRGASGTGKSRLVRELLARAAALGRYASLVADDRVAVTAANGRLIARPHPRLAGLIEVRGLGLRDLSYEPAAVVRLLVDLVAPDDMPRMPHVVEAEASLHHITVPRLFAADAAAAAVIVMQLLAKPGSPLAFRAAGANHARSLMPATGTDDLAGGRED